MNTKLIAAEDFAKRICNGMIGNETWMPPELMQLVREAQLNAAKWGIEKAAEIAAEWHGNSIGESRCASDILEAADKLELP